MPFSLPAYPTIPHALTSLADDYCAKANPTAAFAIGTCPFVKACAEFISVLFETATEPSYSVL